MNWLMKKIFILLAAITFAWSTQAQVLPEDMTDGQSCTSIMVGKMASADGSVITSHTCDGRYRTWMSIEPAADHPEGAMHKVYRGTMHTTFRGDTTGVKLMGEIPEARHTYAYLNTAYPCLNEKQLAIGESTFGGPDTLLNPKGMFTIEELQRIVLQRCDNARDAIRLMGELVKKYGYGDGGECLTLADKNEVWQFEIIGAGKNKIGGVWVAQRVPDDQVAVSCNIPRIGKIIKGSNDFMYSENVKTVARQHGLWDGKEEFLFWKAYNTHYANGKNYRERELFLLQQLAPSANFTVNYDALPFSVVPDKKVSARQVMELLRSTYEGTDMDMTRNLKMVVQKKDKNGKTYNDTVQSPIANPWMGGNAQRTFNYLDPNAVVFRRGVSVAWCSYSFVAQMRSWLPDEVGGVLWMAFDNPAESPRVPIFCGTTRLPKAFGLCGHGGYSDDAVLWQYRKANKLATVAWQSTKKTINEAVQEQEDKAFKGLQELDVKVDNLYRKAETPEEQQAYKRAASNLLNDYTYKVYDETSHAWKKLEHKMWERFGMGF